MKTATLRTRLAMLATPATALEAVELRVIRSELAAREYRAELTAKVNGAARVQRISLDLQAADAQQMAMARACAFIANNPAPRALFLVG